MTLFAGMSECLAFCKEHGEQCTRPVGPGHGLYPEDWQAHEHSTGPEYWQLHVFGTNTDPEGNPLPLWKEPE